MRAQVAKDQTVRTISVEVTGAPDLDVARDWQVLQRLIKPEWIMITLVGEKFQKVQVRGPLILKNGKVGKTRGDFTWYTDDSVLHHREKLSRSPQWIRDLVQNTPHGLTAFSWPDQSPRDE